LFWLREGGKGKEQGLDKLHTFLGKLLAVSCIVVFVVAVFSVGVVFVVGGPPSSGDWIVTGTESYSDQTIVLDGNLIVENGGNLTFENVTFELNCHFDGEYNITVNPGGKFYVLDGSVITSHAPSNAYSFFVQPNSTFRMSNSELHSAGWIIPFVEEHMGLHILSDDAVVENSLISNNSHSIMAIGDGVVIRNNNITENYEGIRIGGAASIYNNYISKNGGGVTIGGPCSPSVYDNTIEYNSGSGICIADGTPIIRDNNIIKNREGIHLYSRANPMILNNTIASNNDTGVTVRDHSSGTIQGNIIVGNQVGVGIHEKSNPTIQGNNISHNGAGFLASDSNPTIEHNNITSNSADGINFNKSDNATIKGNNITANAGIGIALFQSGAFVTGNTIKFNKVSGIWGEWSSPTITGNNISSNYWGIHLKSNSTGIIQNNFIANNSDGINLYERCNPLIKENDLQHNSGNGISVEGNSNATVEGNIILKNQQGVLIRESSPMIQGNKITHNFDGGVFFGKGSNGLVQGNLIDTNFGDGIFLGEGQSTPSIFGNIIRNNRGNGIHSMDVATPNIQKNDIYSNEGYGILVSDSRVTVKATDNYWGSANGPVQTLIPDATDPEEVSLYVQYNPWLTEPILIVEITNPLSNETVSATVTVSANIRAINGVHRVEFYIDELRYTDFDSPYEWNWDTTQYAESSHTIWILVHDVFGLENKVSRTVFVDNTSPTAMIKEPQSGITYYGMVTISVNATDNREVSNVRVKVDNGAWLIMVYNPTNSFWEYNFNTTTLSDAQHNLMVLALDKAGNPATTSISILTDNTPPSLTIQHPQSGITVGLTLTVTTQASDISGVSRVEFYLGQVLVSTVNFAPYQWAWDTTRYPNGVYTITIKAYDTIGNVKTKDITVTVNNVEVPWLQANLLTIIQVVIGIGGLALAVVTYWSRTREKRKKKKIAKKKEKANVSPKKDSGNED